MDENIEILQDIYKKSEISLYALDKLAKNIKHVKKEIKEVVKEERKSYKNYVYEIKQILNEEDVDPISNSFLTKLGSGLLITMKVCDDDLNSILDILKTNTQNNLKEIEQKYKEYQPNLKEKILEITSNFLEYQKKQLEIINKCL